MDFRVGSMKVNMHGQQQPQQGAHRNDGRRTQQRTNTPLRSPFLPAVVTASPAQTRLIIVAPLPIKASEREQDTSRIRNPASVLDILAGSLNPHRSII